MTLATILRQAEIEGVRLTLSGNGKIKAAGQQSVVDRWLPFIQQHKPEIVRALLAANEDPMECDEGRLARLVARVCRAYHLSDGEIVTAIDAALADFEAARATFEGLARRMSMPLNDDRRFCFECGELKGKQCMAAKRGQLPGTDRRHEPMKYQPRRCEGFKGLG